MITQRYLRSELPSIESSPVLDGSTRQLLCDVRLSVDAQRELAGASSGTHRPEYLLECLTVDQFSKHLSLLPARYGGPSSFCGATSCSNALALCEAFEEAELIRDGDATREVSLALVLDVVRSCLCIDDATVTNLPSAAGDHSSATIVARFDDALRHVAQSRQRYIDRNLQRFRMPRRGKMRELSHKELESSVMAYRSAWIANFEVSDYLREKCSLSRADCAGTSAHVAIDVDSDEASAHRAAPGRLIFVRRNQWPMRELIADHEEYDRMLEEARFGGAVTDAQTGAVTFAPGDCSIFVEAVALRTLLSPAEFLQCPEATQANIVVSVVDLEGHFAAMVSFCDADNGGCPTSLLVNTVKGYAAHPMFVAAHDLIISTKLA